MKHGKDSIPTEQLRRTRWGDLGKRCCHSLRTWSGGRCARASSLRYCHKYLPNVAARCSARMRYRVVLPRNQAQRSDQHDEREEAPKPYKSNPSGTELAPDERARGGAEERQGERARKEGE